MQVSFANADPDPSHPDPINNKCGTDYKYSVVTQGSKQTISKPSNSTCTYAVSVPGINVNSINSIDMTVAASGCDASTWASVFMYTSNKPWTITKEIDFIESFYGGSIAPFQGDVVNTNFAGKGNQKTWGECQIGGQGYFCPVDKFNIQKMSQPWNRHVSAVFNRSADGKITDVFVKNCPAEAANCFDDADLRNLNNPTMVDKICTSATSNVACFRGMSWSPDDEVKFVADIWKGKQGCQLSVDNFVVG